ncbi:MAG: hypothetical protein K2G36_05935 [Ruminococcus sp.]|nr:hypothetical protein [Ruminococcus sp.]
MKNFKHSPKKSVASDIRLNTKSAIINIISILSSLIVITAMIHGIYVSQQQKHSDIQQKIVTASEQLMEMTIDSGVNIAKSIYINEHIYDFLNTEYRTSGDYYDAFYSLQHNNPMAIADTNIINHYMLYTENNTILTGSNISTFGSVTETDWYHAYKKLNKPMILYIDDETNEVSIIRRLDFQNLTTGESCLKLDLNMKLVTDYCDNLDFNGKLYIINGGSLIYSNVPDMEIEDTDINPDFECYIKNYYTADIEYYAYENRKSLLDFFTDNILFIIIFILLIIMRISVMKIFNSDIKKRIRHSAEMILNESGTNNYSNGRDEIGEILDMCIKASERLAENTTHNRRHNEEIRESSTRYRELLNTAMHIDAELVVSQKYHDIFRRYADNIPISYEINNIRHIVPDIIVSGIADIKVPPYSLFMIADDLKNDNLSVIVSRNKNNVEVMFRCDVPEQLKILRLNAIFEEKTITNAYSFSYNNQYNPYLRIVHSLSDRITVRIRTRNKFTLCITIKPEKSDTNEI